MPENKKGWTYWSSQCIAPGTIQKKLKYSQYIATFNAVSGSPILTNSHTGPAPPLITLPVRTRFCSHPNAPRL